MIIRGNHDQIEIDLDCYIAYCETVTPKKMTHELFNVRNETLKRPIKIILLYNLYKIKKKDLKL